MVYPQAMVTSTILLFNKEFALQSTNNKRSVWGTHDRKSYLIQDKVWYYLLKVDDIWLVTEAVELNYFRALLTVKPSLLLNPTLNDDGSLDTENVTLY